MSKDVLNQVNLDKDLKLGVVSAILSEEISKRLFGQVLTITDVASKDAEQRKAVRSLISQAFSNTWGHVLEELNKI